ncbi:MAG: hypothetical protein V1866_07465 [archaeon]
MIYLILSLTFVTSLAFAEIYSVDVYGRDNIPGTVRSGDSLTVKSTSIMPASVQIPGNDSFIAMTCGTGIPITCSFTKAVPNMTGKIDVKVKESGSDITNQASAYVDNLAPSISSFTTSSLGWGVIANYNLKDQANEFYTENCSGIKKVELLLDGKIVNTTSYPMGKCDILGSLTGTIANFEGTVNTSINVYDYLDQKTNRTGTMVAFESIPPRIATTAKVYKAGTDVQITKYSNASAKVIKVDVKVTITDSAMLAGNVVANLTELDRTTPLTILTASSCDEDPITAGNFICVFSDVNFKPAKSNPKIRVTAKDSSGNVASQDITFSFTMVSSAGTVKSIGPSSERCFENKCYLKRGENDLIAQIDTSSSFNSSDVLIGGVQAICLPEAGWSCNAKVMVTTSAIKLEGYDDIGNPIQGIASGIIIDSTVPEKVTEFNVTPPCPISSESLRISVDVIDNSPALKIKAATGAISSSNMTEAPCTKNEFDQWSCVLSIGGLKNQQINTPLRMIVEDLAGNQLVQNVPVSICVSSAAAPRLIKEIKVIGTLPRIDKKVASKINIKAPISLEIVPAGSIYILERSTIDCSGTPGANEPYMINDDGLKPILIIPLSYDEDWDTDNKVHVNCTQEFMLRSGNVIYTTSEVENISFDLTAFNQGLGTLDASYAKKLKTLKTRTRALDDEIEKYQKTWSWLGTGCKFAEGASKANSIVQAWRSALWGVSVALYSSGIGTSAAEAVWKLANVAGNKVHGTVEKYLWPAGWLPSNGNFIGLAVKWTCSIYTCKLYDFNTVFSMAMTVVDQAVGPPQDLSKYRTPDAAAGTHEGIKWGMTPGEYNGWRADKNGDYKTFKEWQKKNSGKGYWDYYAEKQTSTAIDDTLPENKVISDDVMPSKSVESEPYEETKPAETGKPADNNVDPNDNTNKDNKPPVNTAKGEEKNKVDLTKPESSTTALGRREAEFDKQGLTLNKDYTITTHKVDGTVTVKLVTPEATKVWLYGSTGALTRVQYVSNTFRITEFSRTGYTFTKVIYSDSITGQATGTPTGANTGSGIPSGIISSWTLNKAIQGFMGDEGSWTYNPYKSVHYDDWCPPAIMFNDRKERQLNCKRIGCYESMKEIGGPLEACDFDYSRDMCMYVESARYKISGDKATFGNVMGSMGKQLMNNIVGIGASIAYAYFPLGCRNYQMPNDWTYDTVPVPQGFKTVACGLVGSAMAVSEIISFLSNPWNALSGAGTTPVDIPADSVDYCSGVNYESSR